MSTYFLTLDNPFCSCHFLKNIILYFVFKNYWKLFQANPLIFYDRNAQIHVFHVNTTSECG